MSIFISWQHLGVHQLNIKVTRDDGGSGEAIFTPFPGPHGPHAPCECSAFLQALALTMYKSYGGRQLFDPINPELVGGFCHMAQTRSTLFDCQFCSGRVRIQATGVGNGVDPWHLYFVLVMSSVGRSCLGSCVTFVLADCHTVYWGGLYPRPRPRHSRSECPIPVPSAECMSCWIHACGALSTLGVLVLRSLGASASLSIQMVKSPACMPSRSRPCHSKGGCSMRGCSMGE